jgi:hypothetical protein
MKGIGLLAVAGSVVAGLLALGGCVHPRTVDKKATDVDPRHATADYWLDQPAVAKATAGDFDRLWNAADRALRDHRFEIDRADRRSAVMTTLPLSSKELFEVWRNDVPELKGQAQATLAQFRRIVRLEFTRTPDGQFQVEPRVVVQRHAVKENRVTAAINYRNVFNPTAAQSEDVTADRPVTPSDYWYSTGRDPALERELARQIQKKANR